MPFEKRAPSEAWTWPKWNDRSQAFDELLLRVRRAGICGSDRHLYAWDSWAELNFPTPFTLGHEIVGEVAAVGAAAKGFEVGELVAVESHIFCGVCRACRTGNAHVCEDLRILGIDVDGGFAEHVAVPARVAWKVRPEIPLERAVLFEPLGNAVHAAMRFDVSGQPIAVYGCGPMGLMSIAVAHSVGAYPIVASDVSAYRRGLAETMGAHATLDAASPSFESDLFDALGSRPTVRPGDVRPPGRIPPGTASVGKCRQGRAAGHPANPGQHQSGG